MKNTKNTKLPELVSPAFRRLIDSANPKDAEALKREVYFSQAELNVADFESADPLGEKHFRITENCVHQYPNRILVLTTGRCLSYCRYCFRREFTARERDFLSDAELQKILDYLASNPQISEILLSGGDPLSASFSILKSTFKKIRNFSENILIRLCTRGLIFAPELFTPKFIALLKSTKPLWIIPHINHPAELGREQQKAITDCVNAGLPMFSQTVLLKDVNDSPKILSELFSKLINLGVKPGYLFQLDTAKGTSHFAVPLKRTLEIWEDLLDLVSGLSRPQLAVDLQNGGGKFPLSAVALHNKIISINENGFKVKKNDGRIFGYKG